MNKRPSYAAFLPAFFTVEYMIFMATAALFLLRVPAWNGAVLLLLIPALFFYPLLYLTGPAFLTILAAGLTQMGKHTRGRAGIIIAGGTAWITFFICHLLLLLDAGLYFRYAYHINPHVLNIFTTPGGFESMGLRTGEVTALTAGIVLLALAHGGLLFCFMRFHSWSFLGTIKLKWRPVICCGCIALFFGAAFLTSFMTYTYHHYVMNPQPLLAADVLPFYIKGISTSFYKSLKIQRPTREMMQLKLSNAATLQNYPAQPIVREKNHPKYNVVWLACESWAAKLYSAEIMPKTAEFAKQGVYFQNHYSGGNVTRQGVFSMFYALPASYWHPFLAARRGPLFIDWLMEDGYAFKCITSSKFTYPEFDQTVFFRVADKDLISDSRGKTYERDQRNIQRLLQAISDGADSGKPFFTFMFFESPHNPYEFPPEAKFTTDYMDPFIATQVTAADGPRIFRRAANCARHLDMCLDKVYQLLRQKDLLKNTIVVIVGDHGEEFFEKGYLGHSSSFVNEQTRAPLILYYPGIKPGVYTAMSSHLDIVPMLAKLLGVRNDPRDFSCGFDLLSADKPRRRYALIANWSDVFFAGEKYKSLIPKDAFSLAKQVITDAEDRPLENVELFYQEYGKDLQEVQKDLTRFTARRKSFQAKGQ